MTCELCKNLTAKYCNNCMPKMINSGMFSSNTDLWSTPQDIFDELNSEFNLDLDVCANSDNFKCFKYFAEVDNGLEQNWDGHRCWCNPPYGREIRKWVKKASESDFCVMLLPARTDTRWFHDYIYGKAEIRFIKGRLKFGDSKNSAPFPSMIVIFKQVEN